MTGVYLIGWMLIIPQPLVATGNMPVISGPYQSAEDCTRVKELATMEKFRRPIGTMPLAYCEFVGDMEPKDVRSNRLGNTAVGR